MIIVDCTLDSVMIHCVRLERSSPITSFNPERRFEQVPDSHNHPVSVQDGIDLRALLAVLLAVALSALDTAIANTALPTIGSDLHAPASASIWVINAYQLSIVASLLPLAALGDLWGPRRVFLWGLGIFTAFSLACALSSDLQTLALCRWGQGFGAAGIMSVNIALIRVLFPKERLGRGVGFNALVVGVSSALGPTVASLVLLVAPWQWLFGLNVPLGLLALWFAWPAIPRMHKGSQEVDKHGLKVGGAKSATDHTFDPLTAIATALTFGCLIYALTAAAQRHSSYQLVPFVVLGLIALIYLLRRQGSHPAPMLPVDLLKRPMFALSTLTSITSFAAQGLAFVALPFYFEQTLHRDSVETGFLITTWPILVAIAAPIAGRLSDKYPPGLLGGIGLSVLSFGFVLLAMLPSNPSVLHIVICMAICGVGFGGFQSPNLKAIMSSAPPNRSGGASGVIAMGRLIGQTSGAAVVALCLGLWGDSMGPLIALAIGAGFAGLAALASFSRLWVE